MSSVFANRLAQCKPDLLCSSSGCVHKAHRFLGGSALCDCQHLTHSKTSCSGRTRRLEDYASIFASPAFVAEAAVSARRSASAATVTAARASSAATRRAGKSVGSACISRTKADAAGAENATAYRTSGSASPALSSAAQTASAAARRRSDAFSPPELGVSLPGRPPAGVDPRDFSEFSSAQTGEVAGFVPGADDIVAADCGRRKLARLG